MGTVRAKAYVCWALFCAGVGKIRLRQLPEVGQLARAGALRRLGWTGGTRNA